MNDTATTIEAQLTQVERAQAEVKVALERLRAATAGLLALMEIEKARQQ